MAREVIWSKEATSDLESIAEYIAKDSTFYAAAFIQEMNYPAASHGLSNTRQAHETISKQASGYGPAGQS